MHRTAARLLTLLIVLAPVLSAAVPAHAEQAQSGASIVQTAPLPTASKAQRFRSPTARYAPLPVYPAITETTAALVILVGFPNQPSGALNLQTANSLYFGSQNSVSAYFLSQSRGLFRLSGQVVGGASANQQTTDVIVPHSMAYYDSLGGNQGELAVMRDAVNTLAAAAFNFAPYENATGAISQLVVLTTAPDASSTNSPFYSSEVTNPGISVGSATVANADLVSQTDPLGILAHEFGHMLGFVDTYDTNVFNLPSTATGCVTGMWDLYDQGAYNGPNQNGTQPAPIDPYQLAWAGWLAPTMITAAGNYTLAPVESSGQVYEIAFSSAPEVYLLENLQPIGYDSALPGSGLLIWRIDTQVVAPSSTYWQNDAVNASGSAGPPYPGISVVPAGNQPLAQTCGSASDPFPGSNGVSTFSDATTPSASLFGNVPSHIALTSIQSSGQSVLFTLSYSGQPTLTVQGPAHPLVEVANTYTVLETTASGALSGAGAFTATTPWGPVTGSLTAGAGTFEVTPTAATTGSLVVSTSGGLTAPSFSVTAGGLPYADVGATSWEQPAVAALYARGDFATIPGWTGSDFLPAQPVTRGEFVALLLNVLQIHATASSPFSDVAASSWYAGAVGEAYSLGLVNGTSATTFSPNATLTRAQLAALLVRAFALSDSGARFSYQDVSTGAWYYLPLTLAWQVGLLKGVTTTTMVPNGTTTRAQVATVLNRVLTLGLSAR
ncbi:MAG: S-layer homology domain-containing protein [Sulfobacillus sp.]